MRVFLTGADGYIGSLLAPYLMDRGHEVVGLDTGYYREGWLYNPTGAVCQPLTITRDLRDVRQRDVEGFDAIVHLAELSNDPLGENNPTITHEINHGGSVALAVHARNAGIDRFVYTSSCSVYGAGTGDFLDETAETRPQTAYAECKILVERDIGAMAGDDFCPVFLRNATAYGPSPRMRFDIVLNNLAGLAFTTKKIAMTSDGSPWRPLVHVLDICHAIACALEAPRDAVCGEIFNVGRTDENYRVHEIATIVGETFPGCEVTFGSSDGDNRSYRVSFDKIAAQMPGYAPQFSVADGARQLLDVFRRIGMDEALFEHRAYTRLKTLRHLIATRQIDARFFWIK